jgi:hypothetical protein
LPGSWSPDLLISLITSVGLRSGRNCHTTAAIEEATAVETELPVYIIVG